MTLRVYGTDCSYYTGKLEAYLRAKGIAYRLEPFGESNMKRAARHTGVIQIPQAECDDGSWLVDTTLIIEHFERVRPEPAIAPHVPAVSFVSRLLEDFGDEWLWRPAMHFRWSFPNNARFMSGWLAEHATERRAPLWLKRSFWYRRQLGRFVDGDGVTAHNRAAVEASYLDTLDIIEKIVQGRPYLLGQRPTQADFGFFASMFRHFACDPVPGRIMRQRGPGVHEWVARMWNSSPERVAQGSLPDTLPDDLGPLLGMVAEVYLPYLEANARAFAANQTRVRYSVQGVSFEEPSKPYRVWCRDRLQQQLAGLAPEERAVVDRAAAWGEALTLLAIPSPKPAEDPVGALPIPASTSRKPVDSWWRR